MKNTIIVHIHETNRLTLTMMTINVAIILPFLSRCSNLELKIIITIMMMMLLLLCAELKRECVCTAFSMALVKAASLHRLHWLNQNSRKTFGLFSSVCMCRCVCGSVSLKVKHKQWKMDRVGYEMQWAFVPFSQNWSWKLNVKFAQHFGHSVRHVDIIIYICWRLNHQTKKRVISYGHRFECPSYLFEFASADTTIDSIRLYCGKNKHSSRECVCGECAIKYSGDQTSPEIVVSKNELFIDSSLLILLLIQLKFIIGHWYCLWQLIFLHTKLSLYWYARI